MTERSERGVTLACVAGQAVAGALHEALGALFPGATLVRIDTDVERMLDEAVDCAVVDSTVNGTPGIDILRRLRARGYDGAAVLLVDGKRPSSPADDASAGRLGARRCSLGGGKLTPLAEAVADAIGTREQARGDLASPDLFVALRQTQRLVAAGEMAMRLQHSLNNPLAALLAEAQLLEMETLPPDHRESVERIIEQARRVIEVVRGLDGLGRAYPVGGEPSS